MTDGDISHPDEAIPIGIGALDPGYSEFTWSPVAQMGLPLSFIFNSVETGVVIAARVALNIALWISGAVCLVLALKAGADSYAQDFWLNINTGAWFFAGAPFLLRWGMQNRVLTIVVGAGVATVMLVIAYSLGPFAQSVLIGNATALLMLLALDLSLAPMLDRLARAHNALRAERSELNELNDE